MKKLQGISFFDRYLSVWVAICIVVGLAIGRWLPVVPEALGQLEYANVPDLFYGIWMVLCLEIAPRRRCSCIDDRSQQFL